MSELVELTTSELMERLPGIEDAPVLEHLARLGLKRFQEAYARPTPTHNEIVDHIALMKDVGSLVSNDYRWEAPFFDEHHLHWYARYYQTNQEIRFRNLPIHKLWVPRQFHDFIHVVALPPDMPSQEVMASSIESFLADDHIYTIANQAITLRERSEKTVPLRGQPDRVILPHEGGGRGRVTTKGAYERRREAFLEEIQEHIQSGSLDLSVLSRLELLETDSIEAMLPVLRRTMGERVAKTNRRRSARAVKLPIARRAA